MYQNPLCSPSYSKFSFGFLKCRSCQLSPMSQATLITPELETTCNSDRPQYQCQLLLRAPRGAALQRACVRAGGHSVLLTRPATLHAPDLGHALHLSLGSRPAVPRLAVHRTLPLRAAGLWAHTALLTRRISR